MNIVRLTVVWRLTVVTAWCTVDRSGPRSVVIAKIYHENNQVSFDCLGSFEIFFQTFFLSPKPQERIFDSTLFQPLLTVFLPLFTPVSPRLIDRRTIVLTLTSSESNSNLILKASLTRRLLPPSTGSQRTVLAYGMHVEFDEQSFYKSLENFVNLTSILRPRDFYV